MSRFSANKVPSDVLAEIAEKLKFLRKESKLSQAELSERSGVSLGSLKRFESTGQIALEALLKLAHILNRLDDFDPLFLKQDHADSEKLFSDKTRRS